MTWGHNTVKFTKLNNQTCHTGTLSSGQGILLGFDVHQHLVAELALQIATLGTLNTKNK
jgi:hypothetical protein